VAAITGLIAHGGTGGAIIEILLVLGIAAVFFAVWLRERRAKRDEDQLKRDEDQLEDQSKPQ
jgi:hypothetical protein